MSKILILGAGNAQIDLLEYCSRIGMETYCCSYSAEDPGAGCADHFALIDIVDRERIEEYASQNKIEYIYSVGSDIAVPVIAAAAAHTGTPSFVSPETAAICCDKALMREVLRGKWYSPSFVIGNDPESILEKAAGMITWPAEIKPVDSQGQRGVSTVECPEKLEEAFRAAAAFSRKGEVILEEYIEGDEVSVNAYLSGGEVIFSILSDRERWPQFPGGLIRRHHIPSCYEGTDVHRRILELVENCVRSLGVKEGPVYFQIMIREGCPYLIEVTPRLDGCHLWRLIREACGADLLEMSVNHLCFGDPYRRKASGISSSECSLSEPQSFRMQPGTDCSEGTAVSYGPVKSVHVPADQAIHLEFFCLSPGEKMDRTRFPEGDGKEIFREWYFDDGTLIRPVNGHMEKCGFRIYR